MHPIGRKTTPPPSTMTVVSRPRVDELLLRVVAQVPLTCVYASAGSGKTTAIRSLADRWAGPAAWLTLDKTDQVSGRLLVYLEESLKRALPTFTGIVGAATSSGVPHAEIAGMLAESLRDEPLVIVIDNGERLESSDQSLQVLASFIRYLPPSAHLVIASRSELNFLDELREVRDIGEVGDEDLSFTVSEAHAALKAVGGATVDAVEAVVETNGWVTGVLFEAWHSQDHVVGRGGESDPLFGYLAVHIMSQMTEQDREFLVSTSFLTEVTPYRAQMLGIRDAAERLRSLRQRRLPVSWSSDGMIVHCHNRFREYLVALFERRSDLDVAEARSLYGSLLLSEGRVEEAIEEFFRAGDAEAALPLVENLVIKVIERGDFGLADAWLTTLAKVRPLRQPDLIAAQLMLAVSQEDFARGIQVIDELATAEVLTEIAESDSRAASLMGWCLLHAGRIADIHGILAVTSAGPERDAVRYAVGLADGSWASTESAPPELSGSPLDALVARSHCDRGLSSLVAASPDSPWAENAAMPWRAEALLKMGRLDESYEIYQRLISRSVPSPWVVGILGPQVAAAVGEYDRAWSLLHEGRASLADTGSAMFLAFSYLVEAQLHLDIANDTAACRLAVGRARDMKILEVYAGLAEQADLLMGHALLREGADSEAEALLAHSITSALEAGRYSCVDAAAVHWAEACWRLGKVDESAAATATALRVATLRGTNFGLLRSLADFTDVLSRHLDSAAPDVDKWREVGRALSLVAAVGEAAPVVLADPGHRVDVEEFGSLLLLFNEVDVTPNLTKSMELLAFLTQYQGGPVRRAEVLAALFEGRKDESATAYLRQASLRLRKAVPELVEIDRGQGLMWLNPAYVVMSESQRLTQVLARSASRRGVERLVLLREALTLVGRGEYLPGLSSAWVIERRAHLGTLLRDAEYEVAEIALSAGDLVTADEFAARAITSDPFREAAWRVRMRVAIDRGDADKSLRLYRSCVTLLAEIGVRPEVATTNLVSYARR